MKLRYTCPLKWRRHVITPTLTWWSADTAFGTLKVEHDNGVWRWCYCFDEYYDEGDGTCESLKAGKQYLQDFWDERVQDILAGRKEK